MNLLDFIFMLIRRFVPIKDAEFTNLQAEARAEWDGIRILDDPDSKLPPVKKTAMFYVKYYASKWQVRLGLAIGFIIMVRYIQDFMNPREEEEESSGKFGI